MPEDVPAAVNAKQDVAQRWGGRVPIMLGATGHRNIFPADGKLAGALKGECRKLKKQYGSSPFVILSALAEGADRMIAQVAMEELGADLIAVLPMPADEYERDFKTEDSKSEFRAFLERALYIKTAAVPEGDPAWKVDGEPRNEQYSHAGAIIVDHAQVLFAIWDGKPARGTGGTGEQAEWFGRGYSPDKYALHKSALSPLTPPEPGLFIHIDPASARVSMGETEQQRAGKSSIRSILKRTDKYNWDVTRNKAAMAQAYPLVSEPADRIKELDITEAVFKAADGISVDCASNVRSSESYIYYLAFGSILSLNFINLTYYAPWIYLAITIVMAALAARIQFLSVGNRYVEYRGLAEAMRTLFFWRVAGVDRGVWVSCLPRQPGVVHWIAQAARSIEFCQSCSLPKAPSGGIEIARKYWVDDQRNWLLKKERENLKRFRLGALIARYSILASLVTAAIITGLTLVSDANGAILWEAWVRPEKFAAAWQVILGLFAVFELSGRDNRIHLELTKQYASQRDIFESAHRQLEAIGTSPNSSWTAEQVFQKLGEETLQTQAEWLWREHTQPFVRPGA